MKRRLAWTIAIHCVFALSGALLAAAEPPFTIPAVAQSLHYPGQSVQAREREESFLQRTADDPVATFTAALTVFTAVLAIVSGLQLYLLRRAESVARITAEAARLQAETSRKALVATFRPKLEVRRVSLEDPLPGKPLKIEWIVANIGGTPGTITESNATIVLSGPTIYDPIPQYSLEKNSMGHFTIQPGVGEPFTKLDNRNLREWEDDAQAALQAFIYFMGYIQYRDDSGVKRYMAFCRRYNRQTRRFAIVNDPNYEYGD